MKRVWGLVVASVLLGSMGVAAQGLPGMPEGDSAFQRSFVAGGNVGYLMMPPVLVSGPMVGEAKWSPDGKYVAVQRATSRIGARQMTAMLNPSKGQDWEALRKADLGDAELLIYSRQGKLFPIWKGPLIRGRVLEVGWLTDDTLIALTETSEGDKVAITPVITRIAQGKLATSILAQSETCPELEFSPNLSAAMIRCDDGWHVIGPSGTRSLVRPPSVDRRNHVDWSVDGNEPYIWTSNEDGKLKRYYDLAGTEPVALEGVPETFKAQSRGVAVSAKPTLDLVTRSTTLTEGSGTAVVKSLWLEVAGQKEKAIPGLICGDVSSGELSPTGDAVFYVTMDGAAFVRSIVPVDVGLVIEQREKALRANIMNWGKQIGISVIMFAADNDNRLPSPARFAEELGQYLGSASAADRLQSFQYTFTGGSLSAIDNVSNTILGYLPGPNGFVAVYADGHAQWKTGEPKD